MLLQPKIPLASSILPKTTTGTSDSIAPVNLKSIYEDDIFKTHISNLNPEVAPDNDMQIPQPPIYRQLIQGEQDLPSFLEPLPITLTGMMTFVDENQNRIMVRDNRDQIERAYQVGDELEDAQIVRILPNKVLIIRANSQQETLFLREQDIINDLDQIEPNWENMITSELPNCYQIKTKEFVLQVKNIGNLVDLLNLITAYKAGVSIGIKIGSNATSQLVGQLGLQNDDIITSINDIEVAQVQERLNAYNLVVNPSTTTVNLKILRNQQPIELIYTLLTDQNTDKSLPTVINNAAAVQAHVAKNQANFEIINDKIKSNDRHNMAQFKNKISQSISR